MKIEKKLLNILDRAREGRAPGKEDCIYMLQFQETTPEASLVRATADSIMRQRYGNVGMVFAQIGIEIAPCPAKCLFCSFGEGHTGFEASNMTDEEILATALNFTESNELYALFLMTMHNYDFEKLIRIVRMLRGKISGETKICVNMGDFDLAQAKDLKAEGVAGAYHLSRLREGVDTSLDPKTRNATVKNIKEAGLDWYHCCEPIGPEHTPEELAEQILFGREFGGCFQHGAMSRIYVPGTPLAKYGQITDLKLGQVTAVVSLAMLETAATKTIGVHEPNLIGLTSGANTIYAETGANPRDTEKETTGHRGRDIAACKKMLFDSGFSHLLTSPEKRSELTGFYL
ncbi:MAG TPA: radical SAM protein [Bacteroidetes bacterium]|nr:radical SAM protein [Bacteroidota bacterium]